MSVYDKIRQLGITLPPVATPAAAYVPFVQTGNLVFISGHIAKKDGKAWVGQLGKTMQTEEAKQASRAIAVDLMGTLQAAVGGDDVRLLTRVAAQHAFDIDLAQRGHRFLSTYRRPAARVALRSGCLAGNGRPPRTGDGPAPYSIHHALKSRA